MKAELLSVEDLLAQMECESAVMYSTSKKDILRNLTSTVDVT